MLKRSFESYYMLLVLWVGLSELLQNLRFFLTSSVPGKCEDKQCKWVNWLTWILGIV